MKSGKVTVTLVKNLTRRIIVLGIMMCLTVTVGLSVVTSPITTKAVGEASQQAGHQEPLTKPQRDTIVSKQPTIRDLARVWFLQREHLDEWKCIDEIIYRESRWIPNLWNQSGSSAYGLGQLKNSYKWTKNKPLKQFKKATLYAIYRYGTLCKALQFHNQNGYY